MGGILLIGYGNPGRLDDGLGPALAAEAERWELPGLTVDADYQLTVEDASDIADHDVVLFADASVNGREPFYLESVTPRRSEGFSTHSVEPDALMDLAQRLFGARTRGYILGIRGYEFNEFGEGLSVRAQENLRAAADFLRERLAAPHPQDPFDGAPRGAINT
jgi:hydrogenase maturation protease